ncbi:hypothetical protein B0I37DRAFT_201692 [Chaetomium sp. MPI-CAGE-AT-0009]|nr:hypothetical protein B0I37DRAFT_201692 [Chaetomium sp. MPI-CAGE-AT-0009]
MASAFHSVSFCLIGGPLTTAAAVLELNRRFFIPAIAQAPSWASRVGLGTAQQTGFWPLIRTMITPMWVFGPDAVCSPSVSRLMSQFVQPGPGGCVLDYLKLGQRSYGGYSRDCEGTSVNGNLIVGVWRSKIL